MKRFIYKITILTLAVFTFSSCNVDDDDPVTVAEKRSLEASLETQTEIIAIDDNLTSYELVVNFSEALPSYSSIEYTVDGELGSVSGNTGDTSVSIPLNFEFGVNFRDVSIVGFHVVNADARNILPSISGLTTTKVMKQGYIAITISWADASDDIDFGLQPMTSSWGSTFAWIDVSLGFFPPEFLEGGSLADGNYAVFAQFFTAPADVEVNYALITAGGNFSFDILTSENGNILWFTKSTNASGAVSYTFYTEDPA